MFPQKIEEFVVALGRKTSQGEISWLYDDNNAIVQTTTPGINVTLRYSFNEIKEVGEFVLFYRDEADNKEYRFYTSQEWSDYNNARLLFDIAQSSGIRLPF
jgi:hypothetical protein